ncbi:unnamed protein product [Alopecurus aequalis]
MASAAPSGDGGGGDYKPPESAPASLDPPADPQRNGEPVPSSGDADMSAMGMTEIQDNPPRPECGAKRALPSRPPRCRACARRSMIRRGIDPGPQSDDELAATPVPGMELADPPSAASRRPHASALCRNSEVPEPPPLPSIPIRLALEQMLPARRGKKRPLSVEEERGYLQCDVGKKLTRCSKWDGLRWAALRPVPAQVPGFATAGGRDLLAKLLLDVQKKLAPPQGAQKPGLGDAAGGRDLLAKVLLDKKLAPPQGAQKPGFGDAAGGRDLLEKMMLDVQKKLPPPQEAQKPGFGDAAGRRDLLEKMMLDVQKKLPPPQEAQKPSSSPAARVDVLHQKLALMPKVLSNVLIEACVLQVSAKLMRVLCPEVGSTAAAGGGLYGSDWGLVEKAIDDLVNQTGEGMQDIVKTVIPKVFSKEILYDLIVTCVGRFPKLLEDDKGKLTQEKHKQYQKQLDLMVNLTMVYDDDPENFSKIMKLLCKIGKCGPLPSEVIDDISPGLDPSTMEQLYTGMLEGLLHDVDRASPVHVNPISK